MGEPERLTPDLRVSVNGAVAVELEELVVVL